MAITIKTIPAQIIQTSPELVSYWLATESPNNFVFERKDMVIDSSDESTSSPGNCMRFYVTFTGDMEGHTVAVHDAHTDAMFVGVVTYVPESGEYFDTDIPFDADFDGDWFNDHTLKNGYYVEARLTINGVLHPLTIIASPDQSGVTSLDVSGILRIAVALGKEGDYSETVMAETNKSGRFTMQYREQWYGASNSWSSEGHIWYYAECVRSEDQGSNIYDFVPTTATDAPFFNSFTQPVYFVGFPMDISFVYPNGIMPNPGSQLRIVIKQYDSANNLLSTTTTDVSRTGLEGRVCSMNIDPSIINENAAYMTAQIDVT
jgi:hypothetical protein